MTLTPEEQELERLRELERQQDEKEIMPTDSAWDWPLLMYAATVLLHRTEAEFWKMTPRKLNTLMTVHSEINSGSKKEDVGNKQGFIDQVM